MSDSTPMEVDYDDSSNTTRTQIRDTVQRKSIYRNLLNKVEDIVDSDELGLQTVKEIHSIFKEVNELEDECNIAARVSKADETLLDSKVLSSASSLLVKCVESLDVFSSAYEPTDFASGIVQFMENATGNAFEPKDILQLLPDALNIIPQIPRYQYLYGTYDLTKVPEPKQKKERHAKVKEKLTKKQPTQITNIEDEEESIDHIVKLLYEVLMDEYKKNDRQPIKYYDYVIDSENYSRTVENMFYCSFLIRNGQADIDLDQKGIPFIKPMKSKKLKEYRQDEGSNYQMISTISVPEWERHKIPGFIQIYKKKNANKNMN